jgi:hypothetical protein
VAAPLLLASAVRISLGWGLPGHRGFSAPPRSMLRDLSAPSDLVEAGVVDAEVVTDLVQDRLADLGA